MEGGQFEKSWTIREQLGWGMRVVSGQVWIKGLANCWLNWKPHLHGGTNFLFVTVKLDSSEVSQRRRKAGLFQARVDREGIAGYGA